MACECVQFCCNAALVNGTNLFVIFSRPYLVRSHLCYSVASVCPSSLSGGTAAAAPPPFRPGNPDLRGSHPLVTPYYCRLGDLLCFVFTCMIVVYFCYLCNVRVLQYFDTVGWVFWPVKTVAHITYTVLEETLNPAQSIVCLSSVTLCIVAKRCVLEQKLLFRAYMKCIWEIDWYQNEWPWPLFRGRIKVTSTIALHLTLNISETVRDRDLVPKDHQYEMAYGYRVVTWP